MNIATAVLFATCTSTVVSHAAGRQRMIERAVDGAIQPLMAKYRIAGMAVDVIVAGKSYVFNYGVTSTATRNPVAQGTLFEVGSISKTFTATLASYAQISSTYGFGAYVSFVPKERLGIVIPANRSYPIEDRVATAYEICAQPGGEHCSSD